MYLMDFDDRQFCRLREKQHKCIHPSWKCSVCKLYKDNIKDEQRLRIEYLEQKVEQYELLLQKFGIFVSFEHFKQYKMDREKTIDASFSNPRDVL